MIYCKSFYNWNLKIKNNFYFEKSIFFKQQIDMSKQLTFFAPLRFPKEICINSLWSFRAYSIRNKSPFQALISIQTDNPFFVWLSTFLYILYSLCIERLFIEILQNCCKEPTEEKLKYRKPSLFTIFYQQIAKLPQKWFCLSTILRI